MSVMNKSSERGRRANLVKQMTLIEWKIIWMMSTDEIHFIKCNYDSVSHIS